MKRLLIVLCALCALFFVSACAETIAVNPDGSADYSSLTMALEAAKDGDTIVLAGGVYDESQETFPILVEKSIILCAKEGETPVISSPAYVAALELNADGIHMSGIQVDFLRNGMWIQGEDVVVENCSFALADEEWRTSSCGIWVGGAKRLTMKDCTFTGCGVALAGPPTTGESRGLPVLTGMFEVGEDVEFFTTHTFENCLVNGKPLAYVVDLDDAVYSQECGQLIAVECDNTTFTGLECNKASMGIELAYSRNCVVENSIADDAGIFGIYVAKSEDCVLRSCRADRGAHGIDLRASYRCVVDSCSATGGGQGMFFSFVFNSLLINCDIVENGTGFFAASGDNNHMDNCRIVGNQLGIYIQKEPNFTVTSCLFRANWNTGARSTQAPGFSLIECTFEDNWVAAMSNYSDGVFYYHNTFSTSQSCALYMKGNENVRYLGNVFNGADAELVEIYDCPGMLTWE